MNKRTLNILAKLAADLDDLGAIKVADEVDRMMEVVAQEGPVPMGEDYAGQPVTLGPGGEITDARPPAGPGEDRGSVSAKRFTEDTGIEPGPALANVAKIQQGLIDLGYDIGASQPDYDWGPKSTQAHTRFTSDFFDTAQAAGVPQEQIQQQVRFFDSGDVSHHLGLMDLLKKLRTESEYGMGGDDLEMLWKQYVASWKRAAQAAHDAAKEDYPDPKYSGYWRSEQHKASGQAREDFMAGLEPAKAEALKRYIESKKSEILGGALDEALPEEAPVGGAGVSYEGEANDGQVTAKLTPEEKMEKIASDTKKFAQVFWHESSTPFGR
jgi:hypothetical protein